MKNQSQKCSLDVRNLPLERYRLPSDGRKWRQAARSRSALLMRLASYANADGTFMGANGINYSPSFKTMAKQIAPKSFYRLTNDLLALGLLSWVREKHYERRVYTIHLPESGVIFDPNQVSYSEITGVTFASKAAEQVSHSPKSGVIFDPNQVSYSEITGVTFASKAAEQVSHSPKSGVTMAYYPSSLPSKDLPSLPSVQVLKSRREREPSADQSSNASLPLSPAALEAHSEMVMDRAKILSKGKASFSKTAKRDLQDALQKLGPCTQPEIDEAIEAKLKLCSKDDPTSYVIFGSSLAADLVASIRAQRDRKAQAAHTADRVQKRRDVELWINDLEKVKTNLSVDLEDWYGNNIPPYADEESIRVCDSLFDDALAYRESLATRQAPVGETSEAVVNAALSGENIESIPTIQL